MRSRIRQPWRSAPPVADPPRLRITTGVCPSHLRAGPRSLGRLECGVARPAQGTGHHRPDPSSRNNPRQGRCRGSIEFRRHSDHRPASSPDRSIGNLHRPRFGKEEI
jgi:hypothetical protein